MSQGYPTTTRPPLATRQRLNNMPADDILLSAPKRSWAPQTDFTVDGTENGYLENEDVKTLEALENASRFMECSWIDCETELGSWELLKLHIDKVHCQTLSHEVLGTASSSRPYRCRYALCSGRMFAESSQLLEHIVSAHLDSLKLRCPFGCKQPVAKLQSMVHHLSSVHDKTITGLPGARIRLPPPRRVSLPDLPTHARMALECLRQVKPCVTFNPANVELQPEVDPWADFVNLDEEEQEETKSFARLRFPPDGRVVDYVRPIPRGRIMCDGLHRPEGVGVPRTLRETVGYDVWKQRFEMDAGGTETADRGRPARMRQKS